jgi:uroporphyrinogen III methyltransferase/synthase
VEAFTKEVMERKKVLIPRAKEARPILPEQLRQMGAEVEEIAAYQTVRPTGKAQQLIDHLQNKKVDMVTFTSSSTVRNFHALLPDDQCNQLMQDVAVASIGPITTSTALELGLKVDLTAREFTIDGLCKAITRYYTST